MGCIASLLNYKEVNDKSQIQYWSDNLIIMCEWIFLTIINRFNYVLVVSSLTFDVGFFKCPVSALAI